MSSGEKYQDFSYTVIEQEVKNLTFDILSKDLQVSFYWMDKEGYLLGANEQMVRALSWPSVRDVIGKHCTEIGTQQAWENCIQAMQQNKTIIVKETHTNLDGSKIVFLSAKSPLKGSRDQIVGVIGISINISQLEEAEQLKQKLATSEERNRYLKTIGGSISHELRTPLVGIRGGLQAVEKFHPPLIETYLEAKEAGRAKGELELEASQLVLLDQVIKNMLNQTTNAFHIIDMQLKNMSVDSIEKDKFEEHNMSEIIELALAEYPFKDAEEGNIQVQTENDFKLIGDAVLTKHILWNLLKNALYYIKAARKGEITIWLESGGAYNTLHFKDTAQGMPAEVAEKVFQQFFTQRTTGTGLGLAFCKLVMEAYGGKIACQSVEGEYAEFILFFPKV